MMKFFKAVILPAAIVLPLSTLAACSDVVAHNESEHRTLSGGVKRDSTTVYRNPDGTMTTEKDSVRVR